MITNMDDDESQKQSEPKLPPIPPGQVRPLTDPAEVMRWFGAHERPAVLFEYNPFSRYWMNT
jgi:hypothetical protein